MYLNVDSNVCLCVDQECEEKSCLCLPGRVGLSQDKSSRCNICKLRDSLDSKASVALIFIDLNLDKGITFPFLLSFYLKFYFSLRQINNAKIDKTLFKIRLSFAAAPFDASAL